MSVILRFMIMYTTQVLLSYKIVPARAGSGLMVLLVEAEREPGGLARGHAEGSHGHCCAGCAHSAALVAAAQPTSSARPIDGEAGATLPGRRGRARLLALCLPLRDTGGRGGHAVRRRGGRCAEIRGGARHPALVARPR